MQPLSNEEINIIEDVFGEIRDKIRHYPDHADMGWDAEEIAIFEALDKRVWEEAKRRGIWWAR
jgi:hypothetical protein